MSLQQSVFRVMHHNLCSTQRPIEKGPGSRLQRTWNSPRVTPKTFGTCLSLGALVVALCSSAQAQTTFNYTLEKDARTSAGVYNSQNVLVKNLWSNEARRGGAHSAAWDGTTDSGATAPADNYTIKLIAHNINYIWEGSVGNTSTYQSGPRMHAGLAMPQTMAVGGGKAFLAMGFNEGDSLWRSMNISTPQVVEFQGTSDYTRVFLFSATDGSRVYFANATNGWRTPRTSWVAAYNVSDNSQVSFGANGVTDQHTNPRTWNNVIDYETTQANAATGLAVQYNTGGNYLAVSHGALNQVRLLHKTQGNLLKTLTLTAPGHCAFAPNGDLWVVSTVGGNPVARRYASAALNSLTGTGTVTESATISGISDIAALTVHPSNNDIVLVADGSTYQVKCFSSAGGSTPLWTLGDSGGQFGSSSPDVTNTKFWFSQTTLDGGSMGSKTFLAVEDDGSFWVMDRGNSRILHFNADRTYREQVAYRPVSRNATVDPNNPKRVFSNFLEYEVDYSKPLGGSNGSWKLVRNWGKNQTVNDYNGLFTVVTLSNGRTYGVVGGPYEKSNVPVVELETTGLRATGITLNDIYGAGTSLEADGSLQYQNQTTGTVTFYRKPLTGFTSNNPAWGAETVLGSAPITSEAPVYRTNYGIPARTRVTSGNMVISFDPTNAAAQGNNYHLGGVPLGGSGWAWQASKTDWTLPGGKGEFQTRAVDNTIGYPGNYSMVYKRHVLYGFHGEFWMFRDGGGSSVGQANQHMHFYDNGLFVGQFGTPGYPNGIPFEKFHPGISGNAITPVTVKVPENGEVYLYEPAESQRGGVSRWRLAGMDDLKEYVGTGPKGGTFDLTPPTGTGLLARYYDNQDFTTLKTTRVDETVDYDWSTNTPAGTALTGSDTFSVRWSGWVQAPVTGGYTFTATGDDGVRLWVNDSEVFTGGWNDHPPTSYSNSTPINLVAGRKYRIKLEYYENTGGALAKLYWTYPGQAQQIIPKLRLYPEEVSTAEAGNGTGLTGAYYLDLNFSNLDFTRIDPQVNFDWVYNGPHASNSTQDNFSVRWTGQLESQEAGIYTLRTTADDSTRVWINGNLELDSTTSTTWPIASKDITLAANTRYNIRVEFKENAGMAYCRLEWKRPGMNYFDVVPQSQLYPDSPKSGQTAYYKLDESTGTTATDSSGNGKHGTTANVSWNPSSGKNGGSAAFTGSSARITLPDNLVVNSDSQQSVALWFKSSSTGVMLGAQTVAPTANPLNWHPVLYIDTAGKLRGGFYVGNTNTVESNGAMNDGQWHHATLVVNGKVQALYVDGKLEDTWAGTISFGTIPKNQLGTGFTSVWPSGNGGWFNFAGQMDDVVLYNRALSSNEIAQIVANGNVLSAN